MSTRDVVAARQRQGLETALGEHLLEALGAEGVTDLLVNPDGRLWLDAHGQGMYWTGCYLDGAHRSRLISMIAGDLGAEVRGDKPILEGELPGFDLVRVEAVIPPVVRGPAIAFRKPAPHIYPLGDYLEAVPERCGGEVSGSDEPGFAAALDRAIVERRNILVAGGTGSAKTSFLNSLFSRMVELCGETERLFVVEDGTFELQFEAPNKVALKTTEGVSLEDLIRVALRMRPDRIVVGEVRGPEAQAMLHAWNTGHDGGACTIHANSAREALYRVEELIAEGGSIPQPRMIARTIDLVVFLRREGSRRLVEQVAEVIGHNGHDYELREVER